MSVSKEEYAAHLARKGRARQQPTKEPGDLLAIFVAGILRNPLNELKHWRAESRYRNGWHDSVAGALLESGWKRHRPGDFTDAIPKSVHFLANTGGRMDSDGLQAALKPVRDALVKAAVIHDDSPDSGHEFTYSQQINRQQRGVAIFVSLRAVRLQGAPDGD